MNVLFVSQTLDEKARVFKKTNYEKENILNVIAVIFKCLVRKINMTNYAGTQYEVR